jgi:hypothetical protein
MSRYEELASTLTRFAAAAPTEPLKLGASIDMLGTQAYPFTATLLTLPFLQPFPLGFFALIGSSAYITLCLKIIRVLRKLTKPRLPVLVNGLLGKKISGLILISVGVLVAVPLGGVIPFKNLFPSLAVLFYCIGETEQDGLMIVFSIICLCLTILFYSLIFFLFWKFGSTVITQYLWPSH